VTARRAVPLLLVVAMAACRSPERAALPSPSPSSAPMLEVHVSEQGEPAVRKISLEEYVHAAILSEFAPAAAELPLVERMYEVQAIVSRTYAVANIGRHKKDGYDLCDTSHCQIYEPSRVNASRWTQAASEAVTRTKGTILLYDGAPAVVVFHADCGGHTSAGSSVWGGREHAYLIALVDDGPAAAAHRSWRYEIPIEDLRRTLNGDARTLVGDRLDNIVVLDRDAGGRAERLALHGGREAIVRGEALREVLTRTFGPRSIRSTRFMVRREGPVFTFEGQGFGHGVGLCQAGAFARLRAGDTPAAVLQRYFPGTGLRRLH
jgi:stage II sporulation protein D